MSGTPELSGENAADDGSEDPEPEAPTGRVSALETRIDGLANYNDVLEDRIERLGEQVQELAGQLQDEREDRRAAEKRFAERTATLDRRTDMLRLVETADEVTAEQRSATLFQHLERKARRLNGSRDVKSPVKVDHEKALEALHYPDVHRSTIYDDMRRVVRRVGDEDACWYDSGELWMAPPDEWNSQFCWSPTTDETGSSGQNPLNSTLEVNQT